MTNGSLHQRIVDLSPRRRAALAQLLRNRNRSAVTIPRRTRSSRVPLSYAQQRLWFLNQLAPGNAFYNVDQALRLGAGVDAQVMQRALSEVVRRHESLRTTFEVEAGEPVQVIAPRLHIGLEVTDLGHLPAEEREREVLRLATEEACTAFDLGHGPLLRAKLLQVGEEDSVFLLTMHHIVSDGWSMGVFFRELTTLYEAFARGGVSPLEELPIQYADFAVWQRQWLRDEVLAEHLGYWRRQLEGASELVLPTDHARPAVQSFKGEFQNLEISLSLVQQLRLLSQREGVTLFMTLLAAFQVLLQRYSGQTDIVVGAPTANRNRAEIEALIGFFVNTLVLRTDLSGDPTFRQALGRVKEVALGAYAHQDLPFEMLVEDLQPERDLSRNPLFQVTFQLFSNRSGLSGNSGDHDMALEVAKNTSIFDLSFHMFEGADFIRGQIEYATDLFSRETIRRMLRHYEVLLEGIVTAPQRRLSELPLLDAQEREQILVEWNRTQVPYERRCVHELFEAQARAHAQAVAVVATGGQLSYGELDRRANRVARYLRRLGVGVDSLVGLCLERSLEMVVGLLGVLKAGAGYVPLDPLYPAERLALMLEDSAAKVVLSETGLRDVLAPGAGVRVVYLDAEREQIEREQGSPLEAGANVDNLAYVIYTSGSTGRPKGVAMGHRALTNLIQWQCARSACTHGSRTLQFAPLSFDVSFQEVFSTFASGGLLVLVAEDVRRDPERLLLFLAEHQIERVFIPFVALHQLAEAGSRAPAALSLREVITAGEQLQITPQISTWLRGLKSCLVENQYGPTETHVITAQSLEGDPLTWPSLPPIGKPISNTAVYVFDSLMQPVPSMISGHLYVGGDCLARGYWSAPELTRERFVPDPLHPGQTLYRTGDLARYGHDGVLQFLGRSDTQVKLRGFRIELGEVEALLAQHVNVREAVCAVREDTDAGRRLVAYVVLRAGAELRPDEMRRMLQQKLPEYMIPSVFVSCSSLPLTLSGKIDRQALPAPQLRDADGTAGYVAPRSEIERVLAGIWTDVLGLSQVGVEDNFFAVGGHSLLATKVASRIRDTFRVELPLRRVFEEPTVAGLAKVIAALDGERDSIPARIAPELRAQAAHQADVDKLSDAEVDAMLHAMFARETPT